MLDCIDIFNRNLKPNPDNYFWVTQPSFHQEA